MTRIKCLKCGDIIESDGHGKWVQCSCKSCYIDETPNYCRVGGDFKDYEVEVNGEWILGSKYIEGKSECQEYDYQNTEKKE